MPQRVAPPEPPSLTEIAQVGDSDASLELYQIHLLGDKNGRCPEISSNLFASVHYSLPEELLEWADDNQLVQIYGELDLGAPSGQPDPAIATWQTVVVRSITDLACGLRIIEDPVTGKRTYPPGTREFAKRWIKDEVWVGSDEEWERHSELVKSANFAVLMATQQSCGVDDPRNTAMLRFFTADEAVAVLSGKAAWETGVLYPDLEHLALLLRSQNAPKSPCLPIRLVIPPVERGEVEARPRMPRPVPPRSPEARGGAVASSASPAVAMAVEKSVVRHAHVQPQAKEQPPSRQAAKTGEELQVMAQQLMAQFAPRFVEEQVEARERVPDTPEPNRKMLQLYLKPEDLMRLVAEGGAVSWKVKDKREGLYNFWKAKGHCLPDEEHIVQCVCIREPGRKGESTLKFIIQ